jgi:hypothetical protein
MTPFVADFSAGAQSSLSKSRKSGKKEISQRVDKKPAAGWV